MEKSYINKITNIYLMIIIILFPLFVGPRGYENILEIKYYSFIVLSILYFSFCIIFYFYELIIKNNNLIKKIKLNVLDYLIILFLIINIISTIISPYHEYNLLKGLGRGEGLFITIIYILNYFFISKFGKFNKNIFIYFSISAILISLIACMQFFGLNPLQLYKGISGPYNMSYMSTIGNIDFFSAYYTITLTISALCYIFNENSKKETLIYLLSLILGIFIFLLINVDSGKVAFLLTIIIILPHILKNNIRLSKFLKLIAIIVFGYFLNYFIDMRYFSDTRIYKACWHFNHISLLLFISIILLIISSIIINKKSYNFKHYKKIYYTYIPLFIICIAVIYFYDFNISFISDFRQLLHGNFNDKLGNYRLFLWKRSLILFKDYPIIGTGPDTFGLRFMTAFKEDILMLGELSVNDTAANVYLTNLVNLGIIGFTSYLLIIVKPFTSKKYNKNIKILTLTFACYCIQNFFNLSVVIVTPFYWIILAIYNNYYIEKEHKN